MSSVEAQRACRAQLQWAKRHCKELQLLQAQSRLAFSCAKYLNSI